MGPNNRPYNATAILNVPNGVNLGAIPLIAEVSATAPAVLQGFVTAGGSMAGANIDVSLAALQSVTSASGMTSRQLNIPLQTILATGSAAEVDSTGLVTVSSNAACPSGSPMNANCAAYTLVVPASNPSVGEYASSGINYAPPVAGDVLFDVDANSAVPMSGGVADCSPSEISTSKDVNNQPLAVTAGSTTNVARIDFTGCT